MQLPLNLAQAPGSPSRARKLLLGGVIALCLLAVYLPALFCPFVLDDGRLISENSHLRSLDSVLELFAEPVTARFADQELANRFYRPLTFLSFYFDRLIWGCSPGGYHLTSLLLHLANTFLLFRMLRRLLRVAGATDGISSRLSLTLAVCWAILPIQTEAVVYVAARHDLLATFFYLFALDIYTARPGWFSRTAFLACGALSFFAKEVALSLPLTAAAYDLCLRPVGTRDRLRAVCWPSLLLVGFVTARQLLCGSVSATLDPALVGATGWHYLEILGSPFSYSIDHSTNASRDPLAAVLFFSLAVSAAFLTLYRFRGTTHGGTATFALLWAVFSYLPVSNLVPLYSFCADRYVYLPLTAVALLIALHLKTPSRSNAARYTPVWSIGGLLVLGCITFLRANFFISEETLYKISLETSPRSPLLNNNLALIELERGNVPQAEKLLETALRASPDYSEALFNLGRLRFRQKEFREALSLFERVTRLRPDDPDSWYQLGLARLALDEADEAVEHFLQAAVLRANHLGTLYHLAMALYQSGDLERAEGILRYLVGAFPQHAGSALLLEEIERRKET